MDRETTREHERQRHPGGAVGLGKSRQGDRQGHKDRIKGAQETVWKILLAGPKIYVVQHTLDNTGKREQSFTNMA